MELSKKNNTVIWIIFAIIFVGSIGFNSYYAQKVANEARKELREENQKDAEEIERAKILLLESIQHRARIDRQLTYLNNKIDKTEANAIMFQISYLKALTELKKYQNEKDHIPIISNDKQLEYISGYRYSPYESPTD